MSNPSTHDGHTINVGPVTVHDDRDRTHFYGDGCADEHGWSRHDEAGRRWLLDDGTYVIVGRADFDNLAAAFDNYGAGRHVNGYDIFCAARRLVNNTTGRLVDGATERDGARSDDVDPGDDAWG